MDYLKFAISSAWELFNMKFSLFGIEISWFNVMAVLCICSIIFWFIGRLGE